MHFNNYIMPQTFMFSYSLRQVSLLAPTLVGLHAAETRPLSNYKIAHTLTIITCSPSSLHDSDHSTSFPFLRSAWSMFFLALLWI